MWGGSRSLAPFLTRAAVQARDPPLPFFLLFHQLSTPSYSASAASSRVTFLSSNSSFSFSAYPFPALSLLPPPLHYCSSPFLLIIGKRPIGPFFFPSPISFHPLFSLFSPLFLWLLLLPILPPFTQYPFTPAHCSVFGICVECMPGTLLSSSSVFSGSISSLCCC